MLQMKLRLKFAISLQVLAPIKDRLLFKTSDLLSGLTNSVYEYNQHTANYYTERVFRFAAASIEYFSCSREKCNLVCSCFIVQSRSNRNVVRGKGTSDYTILLFVWVLLLLLFFSDTLKFNFIFIFTYF